MEAGPLYRRLLGDTFDDLPLPIRAVHSGPGLWTGRCQVARGSPLSAPLARVMGLPPAGTHAAIRVRIEVAGDGETWTREIGGSSMRSRLRAEPGLLRESMGPVTFFFAVQRAAAAIQWRLRAVRLLGFPLPAALFRVSARESVAGGRYRFEVNAGLVLLGLVVSYDGTLDPHP